MINNDNAVSISDFEHKCFGENAEGNGSSIIFVNIIKNVFAKLKIWKEGDKTEFMFLNYETFLPYVTPSDDTIHVGSENILLRSGTKPIIRSFEKEYFETDPEISSFITENFKPFLFNELFTIRQESQLYGLYDKYARVRLVNESFDSVKLINHYCLLYKGSDRYLYNSYFTRMNIPQDHQVGLFYDCPQVVNPSNDTILYLHFDGSTHFKQENNTVVIGCGTITAMPFYMLLRSGVDSVQVVEYEVYYDFISDTFQHHSTFRLSRHLDTLINIVDFVGYQNDYTNYFQYFPLSDFPSGQPLAYIRGNYSGIVRYHHYEKIRLKYTHEYQYIANYTYKGSKHPILFEYEGKYGYVGLNDHPFAASLSDFNLAFARYTLPSGKRGWLDRDGNRFE